MPQRVGTAHGKLPLSVWQGDVADMIRLSPFACKGFDPDLTYTQPLFHFPLAETFADGQDIVNVEFTVTILRSSNGIGDHPNDADAELRAHKILAGGTSC